jgi:hypothetical protein
MKKLIVLFIAVVGFTVTTEAQVNVSINIGSQPTWGPAGYDHVDYYYMPDIESYYYVPDHVYIYKNGNSWQRSRTLPARYSNYDVYNSHKVVINGVNKPYLQNKRYRQEYAGYKGKHDQTPIRDSRDQKYASRNHADNNNGYNKGNNRGDRGDNRNGHNRNGH